MKLQQIPIIIESGTKFTKPNGVIAIKDGIKKSSNKEATLALPKPPWLKVMVSSNQQYVAIKNIVKKHRLNTVCEEAHCPNISECWSAGTATIMLMGSTCTRACRFCAVDTGNPNGWLDLEEPIMTAKAVKLMGIKYIVLTSVNRDDLPDGGAQHYANTVREILQQNPNTVVEVLTPDFQGDKKSIEIVVNSGIKVFAQNIETVKRLTHPVRDPRASYEQTLNVLSYAKKVSLDILTKTSLMLGLGETEKEILETMSDLREANVDILTFGQYLRPTKNHLPIERYVTPEEFNQYREWGLKKGFSEVVSGALVRSSYKAEQAVNKLSF